MVLSRRLVGRLPNFEVTQRATPGARQLDVPPTGSYDPQGIPSAPSTSAPSVPTTPSRLGSASVDRYSYGTQLGFENLRQDQAELYSGHVPENIDLLPERVEEPNLDEFDRALIRTGLDQARTNEFVRTANYPFDQATLHRFDANVPDHLTSLADRMNMFDVEALSPEEINGFVNAAFSTFEQQKALWKQRKAEALADGQEAVADQYDKQIRDQERQIDEMRRQIDASDSIEQWFQQRVRGPWENAKKAALATDLQPIYRKATEAEQRVDDYLVQKDERLDRVLSEIGFSPEQAQALKEGATLDSAVAAAQAEVLDATKVRPGLLDARKQLNFWTADQKLQESLRLSEGNKLITAETNRRGIARAEDQIGEINDLKSKALARVRRAVEREYADGPQLPAKGEFVEAAMFDVADSLMGDLPPAQQQFYMEQAWNLINAGITDLDSDGMFRAVTEGWLTLPPQVQDRIDTLVETALAGGESLAQYQDEITQLIRQGVDDEDLAIWRSLIDTYQAANRSYDGLQEKRFSGRSYDGTYDNTSPQNVADAKAGEGQYGERVQLVNYYGDLFRNMFPGRRVEGDNYFRPVDMAGPGQAENSDHKTGGALDIFFNAFDEEDMQEYNSKLRPYLDQLMRQGVIRYVVHPGDNQAHNDHVHISFALPGINDADVNTQEQGAGQDRSIDLQPTFPRFQ